MAALFLGFLPSKSPPPSEWPKRGAPCSFLLKARFCEILCYAHFIIPLE